MTAITIAGCNCSSSGRTAATSGGLEGKVSTVANPAGNTAIYARDDGSTKTPVDQRNSTADVALTQAVRKAVRDEEHLSMSGQNVEIITNNGEVTLRGPVASASERAVIVDIATKSAGVGMVHDNMSVADQQQ